MNKTTAFLLCATALAASVTGASASRLYPMVSSTRTPAAPFIRATPGLVTLYSQNSSDSGNAVISQNFTSSSGSFSTYDSQSADDFVVPSGHKWQVKEVDVTGLYYNGSGTGGPATSENVFFYRDLAGLPGKLKTTCPNLKGKDNGTGSFQIALGRCHANLAPGTYWVSVQINMPASRGEWFWELQTTQTGNPAAWQNPGNGFGTGCTKWANQFSCLGVPTTPGGGNTFILKGKDKVQASP